MKKLIFTLLFVHLVISSFSQLVIQMKKEGGVSIVPCKVNGLNLSFIFDTGASDVTISLTEASFMLKNGYLKKEDIIGSEKYLDATGNISEGIVINLKEIEIQGLKLQNVKASIVKTLNAPLLLGQSALSKLGSIKLDLVKNQLTNFSAPPVVNEESLQNKSKLLDFDTLKFAFFVLVKNLVNSSHNHSEVSKYFGININDNLERDSLWASPSEAYLEYNSTSYYYTFLGDKIKNRTNQKSFEEGDSISHINNISYSLNSLISFSKGKGINWNLFDSTSLIIKPYNDNDLIYEFKCDNKLYTFLTAINENSYLGGAKVNLPIKIDSKGFFQYRRKIYEKFMELFPNIKISENQNAQLSFFYEELISYYEPDYNKLLFDDKILYSSIFFEPVFWCERAANLKSGSDVNTVTRILSLLSKGITLYEKNPYPKMTANYLYLELYAYRGQYKQWLEDYSGAYNDYKKVIKIYESDFKSRDALKFEITKYYYNFSVNCYKLKKYEECKLSIQKGMATYSPELDKYLVNVDLFRLYNLKGYLYYFIYKNKDQACKDWSRAGELGYEEAYENIKNYCNK